MEKNKKIYNFSRKKWALYYHSNLDFDRNI